MLHLFFKGIIRSLRRKGYLLNTHDMLIVDRNVKVTYNPHSHMPTLPISLGNDKLNLVIAQNLDHTPWHFYIYGNDHDRNVKEVKNFMAELCISDTVSTKDVRIINYIAIGGTEKCDQS